MQNIILDTTIRSSYKFRKIKNHIIGPPQTNYDGNFNAAMEWRLIYNLVYIISYIFFNRTNKIYFIILHWHISIPNEKSN